MALLLPAERSSHVQGINTAMIFSPRGKVSTWCWDMGEVRENIFKLTILHVTRKHTGEGKMLVLVELN